MFGDFKMRALLVLAVVTATVVADDDLPPSCDRPVYCNSNLLHYVQTNRLFNDSKTFVDLPLRKDQNTTLAAFEQLLNDTNNQPTREQLSGFVQQYFDENSDGELAEWTPTDYKDEPEILQTIRDEKLRQFVKDINGIYLTLGRQVKDVVLQTPNQFSLVPVTHGFIIPGGRFREIYYWDTYWIIEGLLVCNMNTTARGMIENLIELLNKFGKVPNGSRWYYQQRSQPPLLSSMMSIYYDKTKDKEFLAKYVGSLENELNFWLDNHTVSFNKDGKDYTLLRYYAPSKGPRPESYYEDYTNAQMVAPDNQSDFYIELKSGAESGWDFSSRWFITPQGDQNGSLADIQTKYIIPVDLNAIFANALDNIARFYCLLKNPRKAAAWSLKAEAWKISIDQVHWNVNDGIWYDYDILNGKHRQYFYPTNVAPLWKKVIPKGLLKDRATKALKYLLGSKGLKFPGGIPASLLNSGEQWDFPNVWPPLVSMTITALENTKIEKGKKLAYELAQSWVRICYKGFSKNKIMSEKYDAENPGEYGGGGEYIVQAGFGWTNGVVFELVNKYGDTMSLYEVDDSEQTNRAKRSLDHLSVVPLILGGNFMSRA